MTEPSKPRRRRMSVRRRLLFLAMMLMVVGVCVELGGAMTWRFMTGEWFSWSAAADKRSIVTGTADAGEATGAVEQEMAQLVANAGRIINPFVGYVYDTRVPGFEISSYGFVDSDTPMQKRAEDRYVVALVGGSVALQLGLYAGDVLAAELEKSPALRGKKVHIVRMGLGGWKQPQQLFALELAWLRGAEFDAVINLDGFNEVAMCAQNVAAGVPAWFPRDWRHIVDDQPSPQQQLRLGHLAVLLEQRVEAAKSADAVAWSPTLQTLWLARDRRLASRIGELRKEISKDSSKASAAAIGPGLEGRDVAASREEMVVLWRRASIALQSLCEEHGSRYFHFLQPNQYVPGSKVFSPEESAVALEDEEPGTMRAAVLHGYPMLQDAGRKLVGRGVDFVDLTTVFRDHKEPLYVDKCCHVGRQGNEILAVGLAAHVRARLDLHGFDVKQLVASAASLQVNSPATSVPLGIKAVDASGEQVDVSAKGFGTTFVVNPAGALVIGDDGAVRAVRRGKAQVRVQHGGREVEVAVVASWPDVMVLADAVPDGVQVAPAIRMLAGETSKVGCASLPAKGFRVLAASGKPLPAKVAPGDSFGVVTQVLPGEVASLTAEVPAPAAAGSPLFLRLYIVGATGKVQAASNMLIVTQG